MRTIQKQRYGVRVMRIWTQMARTNKYGGEENYTLATDAPCTGPIISDDGDCAYVIQSPGGLNFLVAANGQLLTERKQAPVDFGRRPEVRSPTMFWQLLGKIQPAKKHST